MCDLYPVFKSCCGISVRVALLYIAVLSIVTGAIINAALKKVGLDVASIDGLRQGSERRALHATGTQHDTRSARDRSTDSDTDYDHHWPTTTARPPPHHPPATTAPGRGFLQKVGSVNRGGLNLLAGGFLCLGVLLLLANFMRSPEMALVSVAAAVTLAAASLALLAGVVGECAHAHAHCLLRHLDWFTSFCVTLFWFMYVFCWLFFAGVANAFANGFY